MCEIKQNHHVHSIIPDIPGSFKNEADNLPLYGMLTRDGRSDLYGYAVPMA